MAGQQWSAKRLFRHANMTSLRLAHHSIRPIYWDSRLDHNAEHDYGCGLPNGRVPVTSIQLSATSKADYERSDALSGGQGDRRRQLS